MPTLINLSVIDTAFTTALVFDVLYLDPLITLRWFTMKSDQRVKEGVASRISPHTL